MKRQQWGLYAVAIAVLVVGLVWAGVPAATLLIAGLVLVCPLMMLFMMRGMHGGGMAGHQGPDSPVPASGIRTISLTAPPTNTPTDEYAGGLHDSGRRQRSPGFKEGS